MSGFKNFNLSKELMSALDGLGFTTPTEIQEKAIPILISQNKVDFHGQAQTGTGKTLAFSIPILQTVDLKKSCVQALIVAPTRELVLQICESLNKLAKFYKNISILPIYGGVPIDRQIRSLKSGVHVVVGTPGRLNDHIRRRTLLLNALHTLVLDEADIMLDMGFKEEIDAILAKASKDRQIWLFSATTKGGIALIKKKHMQDPVSIRVCTKNVSAKNTEQFFSIVPSHYRFNALRRILDNQAEFYGIVFCKTKVLTAEIAQKLTKSGYNAACLHGDMDQKMRNKVITRFKDRSFDVLVATDVSTRGIDVNSLTHVINYSLPEDQESYIHRIGRTGRAGKKGIAITFINRKQVRQIKSLAMKFKAEINPMEIPTLADVMRVKMDKALEYFAQSCGKEQTLNGILDPLRSSMNDLSKDKLVNGVINILSDTFLNADEIENDIPDFSKLNHYNDYNDQNDQNDRSNRKRYDRNSERNDQNLSEIVLHVGSEDGIRKNDILKHFLRSKVIDRKQISRIRVIKKRSFVIVCSSIASKVVHTLKGQSLQSRKVRVGMAASRD